MRTLSFLQSLHGFLLSGNSLLDAVDWKRLELIELENMFLWSVLPFKYERMLDNIRIGNCNGLFYEVFVSMGFLMIDRSPSVYHQKSICNVNKHALTGQHLCVDSREKVLCACSKYAYSGVSRA